MLSSAVGVGMSDQLDCLKQDSRCHNSAVHYQSAMSNVKYRNSPYCDTYWLKIVISQSTLQHTNKHYRSLVQLSIVTQLLSLSLISLICHNPIFNIILILDQDAAIYRDWQKNKKLLFSWPCSKVTLTLSHSLSLDMLNNFCLHVYAQKSLFIAENCNAKNLKISQSVYHSS